MLKGVLKSAFFVAGALSISPQTVMGQGYPKLSAGQIYAMEALNLSPEQQRPLYSLGAVFEENCTDVAVADDKIATLSCDIKVTYEDCWVQEERLLYEIMPHGIVSSIQKDPESQPVSYFSTSCTLGKEGGDFKITQNEGFASRMEYLRQNSDVYKKGNGNAPTIIEQALTELNYDFRKGPYKPIDFITKVSHFNDTAKEISFAFIPPNGDDKSRFDVDMTESYRAVSVSLQFNKTGQSTRVFTLYATQEGDTRFFELSLAPIETNHEGNIALHQDLSAISNPQKIMSLQYPAFAPPPEMVSLR